MQNAARPTTLLYFNLQDNDRYSHVNNAVYHAMFDTVINVYLIRYAGLDMSSTASVGFMVRNKHFQYSFASIHTIRSFAGPQRVLVHEARVLPRAVHGRLERVPLGHV